MVWQRIIWFDLTGWHPAIRKVESDVVGMRILVGEVDFFAIPLLDLKIYRKANNFYTIGRQLCGSQIWDILPRGILLMV